MDCCAFIAHALRLCCCCWCCMRNSYEDRDEDFLFENIPKTGHWPNGLLNHPRNPWFYSIEEVHLSLASKGGVSLGDDMGRRKANQLKKSYRPEEFPREEAIGLSTRAVFFKVISKQRPLRLANFVLEGNSFSMTLLISSPLPLRCGANVDLEDYVEERYGPLPCKDSDDDDCKTRLAMMYLEVKAPHLLTGEKYPGWWKNRALMGFEFSRESARGKTCVSVMHEVVQSLGPNLMKGTFVQVPCPTDNWGFSMTLVISEVVSTFGLQGSTPSLCGGDCDELFGPVTCVSKKACKRNLAFLFLHAKAPFLLPVTCDAWLACDLDRNYSVVHEGREIASTGTPSLLEACESTTSSFASNNRFGSQEEPLQETKDLEAMQQGVCHEPPRYLMKEEMNLVTQTSGDLQEVRFSDASFLTSDFQEIYKALNSLEDELKNSQFYNVES